MNPFVTEVVDALMKKQDITKVFRLQLEMAINFLLSDAVREL